jgi:hypothetical protein
MFKNLTEENFQMYAMKYYNNPHCAELEEFFDDLKRIRYIKRLFKKYTEQGILKERLILNHLVVLYNMFDGKAMTRMLLLKLEEYHSELKPFLIMLNYWTTDVGLVDGKKIDDNKIYLDPGVVDVLGKI